MGNHCCASARHSSHSPSLYILDANTSTLTEYNIQKQEFLTYQIPEPIPHLARYCLASNGKIMISGGCRKLSKKSRSRSLIDEPTNETFEYDQEIRTISTKKPMNEPRTGHVLLAFNSAVYSLTGAGSQLKPSITCEKYDILTDS